MRRLSLTFCVCLSDIITAGEVLLEGPNGTQCVAIIVQQQPRRLPWNWIENNGKRAGG
jgi:hypothetical protein